VTAAAAASNLVNALSVLLTSCGFIWRAVLSIASARPAHPAAVTAAAAASSLVYLCNA
jgi:hypothetical protein